MKKITLLLLLLSISGFSQVFQKQAPWMKNKGLENKTKLTLDDVSKSAEAYFKTIDKNKKGSGLKPFERWKYHWSHYTKQDGTIAPAEDLWKAWRQKNELNKNTARADNSNWTSLGPYSHTNTASWSSGQGRVNTVAVDPSDSNVYYAGAPAGGIWKSTDAGVNWSPLTDYLPQIGVSGIAVHPTNSNIIYIATGDDDANDSYSVGVWKSIDGGITWNDTGSMLGNPNSMNEIYIDPNNPDTILVATSSGVHKTIDGGVVWTRKLGANIIDLKMKPNDATTWYAASNNTFFRSTDSGETFTPVGVSGLSGSSRLVIDVTPADNGYVYLVSANNSNAFNGIYKSTDSGATFTRTLETSDIFQSTQSWYDLALTVSDTDPDRIYVGVLNIWRSIDGGDNFTQLNSWNAPGTPTYTHADIHFMRFIDGKFFAGTDGGIYLSTDHGDNFTDLTENLAVSQFYKISVANQNAGNIAGGLQDNGGYAFHEDNWNNYFGADGMDCAISAISPNTYYGFIQYGGSLYQTDNGGLSRSGSAGAPSAETGAGDSGGRWVTPLVSDSKGALYSGYSQLYKLVKGAWSKISNHSFGGDLYHIEIDPNDVNNIYVSRAGNLYRSTNQGVTFTQVPFSNGTINGIEINNNDSNSAWVVTSGGVYASTNILDASPTFTNITGNLPSESKLVVRHHARSDNTTIYVGTTLGVYFLDDTTSSWETFDNNLPNVAVRDLEINEEEAKLYAATYGRGVFISDIPRVLPPNDIRILSIDDPNNTIYCGVNVSPKITVKNQGTNVISSVTVNYNIDGGANSTYNWNGTINSEENAVITIPPSSNWPIGSHLLNVEVSVTNDQYDVNNTATSVFTINKTSSDPTVVNTFEQATDELIVETSGSAIDVWQLGVPNKTLLNKVSSGTQAYVTSLSGSYPNNTTNYLYTNCYDLTTLSNPVMKFQMSFDIEQDWDYAVMEYTTDFGANWNILGSAADANWYNSSSTANGLPGKQWTGEGEDSNPLGDTNSTLHEYSYNLSALTSDSSVIFRFKFISDQAVNEEGLLIDDFVMEGTVLAVDDYEFSQSINVYPNPSEGAFIIDSYDLETLSIQVFDLTGKMVLQRKNAEVKNGNYQLNMDNYAKGLYFAKISSKGKQTTKKLILE